MIARSTLCVRIAAALLLAVLGQPANGVTHLKSGQVPPPIDLDALDGGHFTLDGARGRPLVIVFGELYHARTLRTCGEIRTALESNDFSAHTIEWALIVAQDAPTPQLLSQTDDSRLPATILHDVKRKAFGDYRVTVMPSVVILDGTGRVVHAVAGYTTRLKDIVSDAVRVAVGAMSPEQFEQLLHPAKEPVDEPRIRASRLSSLARQLARRGLDSMAREKYSEALELAPDYAPAQLGLAMIMLRKDDLARAESAFRAALEADPRSIEASLGLAYLQTLRGGEELTNAHDIVLGVLRDAPEEPRAHYLLGLIHQQRNEPDEAIAAFRKAAELLMGRRDWSVIPGNSIDEPD